METGGEGLIELKACATAKDAGRKIKFFLRSDLQLSYSQFSAVKASGGMLVNGQSVHANYLLKPGDHILVRLCESERIKDVIPENGSVPIVYEDADLYIIDKPAPLACQCSADNPTGTLENLLCGHYGADSPFVFRPLNRLDRGTSGLMAAAKHAHACQLLQKQLHTPDFIREYLAVVEGEFHGEGTIDLPIAKEEGATVRRVICRQSGQRAITHYRVELSSAGRSLVRLWLETGRTHQIRVHMAALGHPVTGDFLYGHEIGALSGRFALHSTRIRLLQPLTGSVIELHSPLPDDLRRLLK